MSHFVAYILQFQEIIVYKIPPGGEGVYSQPKVYRVTCNYGSHNSPLNNARSHEIYRWSRARRS